MLVVLFEVKTVMLFNTNYQFDCKKITCKINWTEKATNMFAAINRNLFCKYRAAVLGLRRLSTDLNLWHLVSISQSFNISLWVYQAVLVGCLRHKSKCVMLGL